MKHLGLKILIVSTCGILLAMFIIVVCVWNCAPKPAESPKYEDRAVGDFVVRFYKDYCEIKGTTEQGNEKKYLVIPEYIDGVRVESVGVKGFTLQDHGLLRPEIQSDKLERVYFETTIKVHPESFDHYEKWCPNIKKVFYPGIEALIMNRSGYYVYYPRGIDKSNWLQSRTEWANISYYYNYENAKNNGYYWIDDYDYGGTIEFIPTDPIREGYKFDGWYKEAECINKWDFKTDRLPKEKTERIYSESGEFWDKAVYQETILYAKWI